MGGVGGSESCSEEDLAGAASEAVPSSSDSDGTLRRSDSGSVCCEAPRTRSAVVMAGDGAVRVGAASPSSVRSGSSHASDSAMGGAVRCRG
eukprot:ctg_3902.g811